MSFSALNVSPVAHTEQNLKRVTVFTGSALGVWPSFQLAAADLAEHLAREHIGVVYGGGKVGLMGVVADSALAAGGDVLGVMPQALVDGEIAHKGLTRPEVVSDMHARKIRMAELSDAFIGDSSPAIITRNSPSAYLPRCRTDRRMN